MLYVIASKTSVQSLPFQKPIGMILGHPKHVFQYWNGSNRHHIIPQNNWQFFQRSPPPGDPPSAGPRGNALHSSSVSQGVGFHGRVNRPHLPQDYKTQETKHNADVHKNNMWLRSFLVQKFSCRYFSQNFSRNVVKIMTNLLNPFAEKLLDLKASLVTKLWGRTWAEK